MLRVLSVYDHYEDRFKVFNSPINFRTLDTLEKGINRYLPDFIASPQLNQFKFKPRSFFLLSKFGNYTFINEETREEIHQSLVQAEVVLEIAHRGHTMGEKDYRLRIDIVCNNPEQIKEINESIFVPSSWASNAMKNLTIVKEFNPKTRRLFFRPHLKHSQESLISGCYLLPQHLTCFLSSRITCPEVLLLPMKISLLSSCEN
ncbi:hypothetical protein [Thiomicrorhabdus aquaedulcis]|uniref:hypothetical protein n=1 Tax=Thiomicrorhabdus aquaedulcis TaxID=2211106 RepID=UPI000FD7A2EF|nr:hypothetical protein [Thiomicrorhabdus aquaedulcis]